MERSKPGEKWYLLVSKIDVSAISDDWARGNQTCTLIWHRSKKHPTCRVLELRDYMYASMLIQRYKVLEVKYKKDKS